MLKPLGKVDIPEELIISIKSLADKLPGNVIKHLNKNRVTVKFHKGPSEYDRNLKQININIGRDTKSAGGDFLHEVGHYCFFHLLLSKGRDARFASIIKSFQQCSDFEGGATLHADKYLKHIYGNKLRAAGEARLNGVDIKYHEQFAEMFRIYMSGEKIEKTPKVFFIFKELLAYLGIK
jgi:hypothetical protein